MDIYEAGQRIFKRQWALILLFVLIGMAVPLAIHRLQGTDYVGTARVDLGVDTHSGTDSTALADGVLGLATSPDVLGNAIKQAKVSRSVQDMILNQDVLVTAVGTSGVVDVSVTDPSPTASAAIANNLAAEIVKIRDTSAYGAMQQLMGQLQQQSAALTQQIAGVVDQAKRYTFPLPGLQQQQSDLAAQRAAVDQQIQSLAQTLATAQHPTVLDASQKTGVATQSNLAALVALGAALGLFLGIAVAATREAMRPTLDRNALSRHLGVPLLGRLPHGRKGATLDPWLASYVGAAADAADVQAVQLIPVGKHPADVTSLARALDEAVDGVRVTALQLPGSRGRRATQTTQPQPERMDVGIVVVAPQVMKSKYLTALEQHLQVTRLPLIGVISYRRRLATEIVPAAPGAFESELRNEVRDEQPAGQLRHSLPSTAPTS